MSLPKVRFLHTSDWQLEIPLGGVDEIPQELREPFLDAPFQAAERVIEHAIDQKVDFVLATGDLLPLDSACPYSLEFLLRQWDRLAEHEIGFYWLGGQLDDLDLWPAALTLPAHVRIFSMGELQAWEHRRDGRIIARLVGRSDRKGTWRASDYVGDDDATMRVAAVYGEVPKRTLENKGVDYWALGGQVNYEALLTGKQTACYAGSPQGRRPVDACPHGAVLVEWQPGRCDTRLLETDVWRWRQESLDAGSCGSVESLQSLLTRSLSQVHAEPSGRFGWLIAWTLTHVSSALARQLESDGTLDRLQRALCQRSVEDARWSLCIDTIPAELPAELWEEDTILGDFLRTVRKLEVDDDGWKSLLDYVPETEERQRLVHRLSQELQHSSTDERQRMWRQVAVWGADLLRGDAPLDLRAQE